MTRNKSQESGSARGVPFILSCNFYARSSGMTIYRLFFLFVFESANAKLLVESARGRGAGRRDLMKFRNLFNFVYLVFALGFYDSVSNN